MVYPYGPSYGMHICICIYIYIHVSTHVCTMLHLLKRSRPLNMRSNPWIWRSSDLRTSHFEDPLRSWDPLRSRVGTPNGTFIPPFGTSPHGVRGAPHPYI